MVVAPTVYLAAPRLLGGDFTDLIAGLLWMTAFLVMVIGVMYDQ